MDGEKGAFPQQCQAFSASILIGILPTPRVRHPRTTIEMPNSGKKKKEKKRKQVPYVAHEFEIFYNMAGDTRP